MTLDAAAIGARLTTVRYGRSLDVRAETGSTNDDAREAAARGAPDGHVVVADAQRAGRGARGRVWDSPGGTDLYLSIVARLALAPAALPPLTLAVGVGVARLLESLVPDVSERTRVTVKWPNDVLIADHKCAGILVETTSLGARVESAVIGIGLDVNRITFDPSLDATSLRRVAGRDFDRVEVLVELLSHVEAEVDRFVSRGPAAAVEALSSRLAWRGERVRVGEREGVLDGVDLDGALRLRGGVRVVSGTLRRA